ncbi:vesicle-associated membrane protein 8 isoform X2 [Nematostella vectensis]|uniref:vesicle-associated membrane protein 8 isoform X2 n=1 Tax=Nematostella vectensis TaxID=45351 RepID=UPI0020775CDE|nr:vesicle-associated membrane protein 8 isoform X2 [Nematostella vectensis]
MPLYYSLIARGGTILVDYAETTGNFQQVTYTILEKIPGNDTKCTYVSGSYQFHVIVEDGLVYLCMADKEFGKKDPYAFLEEALYSDPGRAGGDAINKVQREVDEVKDVMTKNIEKVLERGERIDILMDKAETLDNSAQTFQRHSSRLRKKMWWQNTRMCIILIFVLLIIVAIIVLIALGAEGKL